MPSKTSQTMGLDSLSKLGVRRTAPELGNPTKAWSRSVPLAKPCPKRGPLDTWPEMRLPKTHREREGIATHRAEPQAASPPAEARDGPKSQHLLNSPVSACAEGENTPGRRLKDIPDHKQGPSLKSKPSIRPRDAHANHPIQWIPGSKKTASNVAPRQCIKGTVKPFLSSSPLKKQASGDGLGKQLL